MSHEESFITLADLNYILRRYKIPLIIGAIAGILAIYSLLIMKPKPFVVETVFQEANKSGGGVSDGGMASLVLGALSQGNASSGSLLESHLILKRALAKSGLQIQRRFSSPLRERLYNFKFNAARVFKNAQLQTDVFLFENVVYEQPDPSSMTILCLDKNTFIAQFEGETRKSTFNVPVVFNHFRFVAKKPSLHWKKGHKYLFNVYPTTHLLGMATSQASVKPTIYSKDLQTLQFKTHNVEQGYRFLEDWIDVYKAYMESENQRLEKHQFDYLGRRKQELFADYDNELQLFENFLEKLTREKIIFSGSNLNPILTARTQVLEEVHQLDLQESFLNQSNRALRQVDSPSFLALKENREQLKKMSNQIWFNKLCFNKTKELPLIFNKEALSKFMRERGKAQDVKLEVSNFIDKHPMLHTQAMQAQLHAINEMLDLQSELGEVRLFVNEADLDEFEGMALNDAAQVFLKAAQEKEAMSLQIDILESLKKELKSPTFNPGAIYAFQDLFKDKTLTESICTCALKLADEKNLLDRDKQRYEAELVANIHLLEGQIDQLIRSHKSRMDVFTRKMERVNEYVLDTTVRELRQVEKAIDDETVLEKEKLEMKREFYAKQLADVDKQMSYIPQFVTSELRLKMQFAMTKRMLDAITQLIDNKVLEKNLHLAESKIIDPPFVAKNPRKIPDFIVMGVGGIGGFSVVFGGLLLFGLLQGMPVNRTQLELRGYRALRFDGLDSLREMLPTMTGISALIQGRGPDCLDGIGTLIKMQERRMIVLDFDPFPITRSQTTGWVDFVLGKVDVLPIQAKNGLDFVPAGGDARFIPEIIARKNFITLLKKLENEYDHILLRTKAKPGTFEARMLLDYVDNSCVFVNKELMEDLEPYISKGKEKVTFVTYNE